MVSLMLVLASVQGQKCKSFVCSSFDKGTTDICVKVDTAASAQQKARQCDTKKFCSAVVWGTPDDAVADATCAAIPDPQPIENLIVPGDLCKTDKECFGDDAKKKCTGGVCTTTVKTGDDCSPGTRNDAWCPVGTYCNMAGDKKCIDQKKAGDACTLPNDCPTGLACHDGATAGTFVCAKWWSVEAGKRVNKSRVRAGGYGGLLTPNDLCKTHNSIAIDANIIECRQADVATDTDIKRPDGPKADDCKYNTFNDPADATKAVAKTDASYCGFNKDGTAYCGKRKGDPDFQNALKKMQALSGFDALNCHVNTGFATCDKALKLVTKDLYIAFVRALTVTVEAGGRYATYANNDDCVKKSITLAYWGDSAFSSFSMTSIASILLSISAMIYMF